MNILDISSQQIDSTFLTIPLILRYVSYMWSSSFIQFSQECWLKIVLTQSSIHSFISYFYIYIAAKISLSFIQILEDPFVRTWLYG
jgi:hypothetical protein